MQENLPVILALVGIWHNQICDYSTRTVLPYDQRLSKLPAYFQQLEMESNGKGVDLDGTPLSFHSGPVVWESRVLTVNTHSFNCYTKGRE